MFETTAQNCGLFITDHKVHWFSLAHCQTWHSTGQFFLSFSAFTDLCLLRRGFYEGKCWVSNQPRKRTSSCLLFRCWLILLMNILFISLPWSYQSSSIFPSVDMKGGPQYVMVYLQNSSPPKYVWNQWQHLSCSLALLYSKVNLTAGYYQKLWFSFSPLHTHFGTSVPTLSPVPSLSCIWLCSEMFRDAKLAEEQLLFS